MVIQEAKESPRIDESGKIWWYEGDTFNLIFNVKLFDYTADPRVNAETTGIYYVYSNGVYQAVTLPDDYVEGKTYYNRATVPYLETDELAFEFLDTLNNIVHSFTFENIQNNTVNLVFDEEVTEKFHQGRFMIDIKKNGSYIKTLCKKHKVEVE